jgi:hypothetical protein
MMTMTTRTMGRMMMTEPRSAQLGGRDRPSALVATKTRDRGDRLAREAAARRALFAASLAGFVAVFGLIAASGKSAPAPIEASAAPTASSQRVLAEVPIASSGGGEVETIIRIVAPDTPSVVPAARTRAS